AHITLEWVPYPDTIRNSSLLFIVVWFIATVHRKKLIAMDEQAVLLLLKEQFDVVTSQIPSLTLELQTAKASGWTRHGAGSNDQRIPRSMRLDVPKFNGSDPNSWIFSTNEYFSLLETTPKQWLCIIRFNLEGDDAEWYRWMTRNKLITS
nr:prolyl oligopeptidase family protein [Tanacetum cinerariifolium]